MAAAYEQSNHVFINPYNFIPAGWDQTERSEVKSSETESEEKNLVSGVLDCIILPRTPLAVPDTDYKLEWTNEAGKEKTQKHRKYSFFHYADGKPAIPGSTIRGAIRSVYETVTDSCFVTSNTDEVITSRGKNPFLPGVLIRSSEDKNKWILHESERFIFAVKGSGYRSFPDGYCLKISADELKQYSYGQEVSFEPVVTGQTGYKRAGTYVNQFSADKNKFTEKGYLFLGEKFARKHFESIFRIKKSGKKYEIETESRTFQNLIEIHRVYNNEKVNKNLKEGEVFYSGFEEAQKNGVIPVWYQAVPKQDGGPYLSLSFASIGRQAYEHAMGELIHEKKPCTKRNSVCRACALFGMAGEESLGSRIRITDAVLERTKDNSAAYEYHVLKELASPKISYLPFYTDQPGVSGWSYDKEGMTLRGRKYYWHNMEQGAWKAERMKDGYIRTERNATMQLVMPNTDAFFSFKVYYDRITPVQLDELIWTLTFGENHRDSSLCYKIGHGKPIGLGSAKIIINKKTERVYDLEKGCVLMTEDYKEKKIAVPSNLSYIKELLTIMDIHAADGKKVSYPFIDISGGQVEKKNDAAAHKWFNKNYQLGSKTGAAQPWKGIFTACKEPFYAYKIMYKDATGGGRNKAMDDRNIFQAVVTGHDEKRIHLSFERNGRPEQIKIHCKNITFCRARFGELDKMFPVHTRVTIQYIGKENGYDQWHCIGKGQDCIM